MERIPYLWQQFLAKKASDQEVDELFALIADPKQERVHLDVLDTLHSNTVNLPDYVPQQWQFLVDTALRQSIDDDISTITTYKKAHRIHFLRTAWFRYAAAVVLLFAIGAYLWIDRQPTIETAQTSLSVPVKNDVPPGGNKAVLILGDASELTLDSLAKGTVANQGNMQVVKTADGEVLYVPKGGFLSNEDAVFTNTMRTPRGGQYQLKLPDGTQVWLNAASSITYPTQFTKAERNVSVTGEVYFEVTKDPTRPFIVQANNQIVKVLGTKFNINAYPDETFMYTTLLEGSVQVSLDKQANLLLPGQQAQSTKQGQLTLNTQVNTAQVMAWRYGAFGFDNADVSLMLRQLARWYNIDIVYEGTVPTKGVFGEMGRNLTLSQAVEVLNKFGIPCRMHERQLIVLPAK